MILLAACDRSIHEIEQQRNIWKASEPSAYSYTIQVSGWRFPPDLLDPKRVTVSARGVTAEYRWRGALHDAGEAAVAGTYWSPEEVFDELVAAKHRNARVTARFDERFGFVQRAFVEYDPPMESWDVEIREFEIAAGSP